MICHFRNSRLKFNNCFTYTLNIKVGLSSISSIFQKGKHVLKNKANLKTIYCIYYFLDEREKNKNIN